MSQLQTVNNNAEAIERVVIGGDLSKLNAEERVNYYKLVCESVGLNPLTKPFEYIMLNGKLTLYARKDATDQLRQNHQVSITIQSRETTEGCYVVTARATLPTGRTDESLGAVPIENLKGENRANAMMKCETKAKRRVTLSICGLGMLDELEIETIPSARPPADVQRTTEPTPISRSPVTQTAQAPVKGGAKASEQPQGVPSSAPERQPGEDDDVVDFNALADAVVKTIPEATIDLPRQRRLHRAFKDAVPNKTLTDKAKETIFQEWLKHEGYAIDGRGSTIKIPELLFDEVLANATKYAATLR